MDTPPGGEADLEGNRLGGRKSPHLAAGKAQKAGRLQLDPKDAGDAPKLSCTFDRADFENRVIVVKAGFLADMQGWEGVEDLQPQEKQKEKADRPDPIGDPDQKLLALGKRALMHREPESRMDGT